MEIRIGEIVMSTAGRDSGKLFVVLDVRNNFVLLADGRLRRVEKAKLKKLKHVKQLELFAEEVAAKIAGGGTPTNPQVRKALSDVALEPL